VNSLFPVSALSTTTRAPSTGTTNDGVLLISVTSNSLGWFSRR
jgi:hypothetical protein